MSFKPIELVACTTLILLTSCAPSTSLTDSEQLGRQLFIQNCGSCHATVADTLIVGPSLAGIASRAGKTVADLDARAYIEQAIIDPGVYVNPGYNNLMPKSFGAFFSEGELDALVGYLMTLN